VPGKNIDFGRRAEDGACAYLRGLGYRIITRNYKARLGEIDIIAQDQAAICFIEVKARSSLKFGLPQEAVTRHKQEQISSAAVCFLKKNKLFDRLARADVVSVLWRNDSAEFELIKDAFELGRGFTL